MVLTRVDEWYSFFKKAYSFISSPSLWLLGSTLIIFTALSDLFVYQLFPYWLKNLFDLTNSAGNLIAITVVIWTFTVTLSTIYFGKLDFRCYGVRYVDVLLMKANVEHLIQLVAMIVGELFVLIISAFMEWYITLVTISFLQFFTMIHMALMVWYKTRRVIISEYIAEELKEICKEVSLEKIEKRFQYLLLIKMIKNMDYSDQLEEDKLVYLLSHYISSSFKENAEWLGENISSLLINESTAQKEQKLQIIKKWSLLSKNTNVKKGILNALIENLNPQIFTTCIYMIDNAKTDKEELILYFVIHNTWYLRYENEQWRGMFNDMLMGRLHFNWTDNNRLKALHSWKKMFNNPTEQMEEFYYMFQYLY